MSASLNSEAGTGVGIQSTPNRQTPVSEQQQDRGRGGMSSSTRKRTEITYLTTGHRGLAQKPKKAKARKP